MTFDEMYGTLREGVVLPVVDAGPQPDEIVRLQMALDAAEAEVERLRGALRVTGGLAVLAQCPVCLAERTNGEHHDDDCPLVATR